MWLFAKARGEDMKRLGGMKDVPEKGEGLKDGRPTIKFRVLPRDGVRKKEDEDGLRSEARILKLLKDGDRTLLGYTRIIEFVDFVDVSPVVLQMELIQPYGFTMTSLCTKYFKANLPAGKIAKRCCRHLYEALSYLQANSIVHGDMKPENVCITRTADVKLIDFGCSCRLGESPHCGTWPNNSYIAPEARGENVPADHAQDMYGVYVIFNDWQKFTIDFPKDFANALEKLGKEKPQDRMTLTQLGDLTDTWISRVETTDSKESELHLKPIDVSSLPLKGGFAIQVTNPVLKMGSKDGKAGLEVKATAASAQPQTKDSKAGECSQNTITCGSVAIGGLAGAAVGNTMVHVGALVGGIVGAMGGGCLSGIVRSFPSLSPSTPKEQEKEEEAPLDPVTIGQAALMAKGIQVLYVDRRFRKQPVTDSEEEIVRVPEFNTKIAYGDWMYVGFREDNQAEGATVYFKDLADQAAKFDTEVPNAIPKWFECDEFDIPDFAIRQCIGPPPERFPEGPKREQYKTKTSNATGYLNLRNKFGINLAGVKRQGKNLFFPGAELVFEVGDVGLLVRSENTDGDTEPTHSAVVLANFKASERAIA